MGLGDNLLCLTDDEILLVRKMLNQESLKDEKITGALTLLTTELSTLRGEWQATQASMNTRLTKVERMAWIAIGSIGTLVTGLPALDYIVSRLSSGS